MAISEQGRINVSGPEVIENNKGVEEFDSKDRALVWRVTGGRTRTLLGGADEYVDDESSSFRDGAIALLKRLHLSICRRCRPNKNVAKIACRSSGVQGRSRYLA